MAERLRVVIAEDNYLVREGTRRLLEDSQAVDVLAGVGTASELLDAVDNRATDAVLTDIRMPLGHQVEGIDAPTPSGCVTPPSASSCSPSTPRPPTPSSCSATAPTAWATC
jgi:CheY-like chemotaxis protein